MTTLEIVNNRLAALRENVAQVAAHDVTIVVTTKYLSPEILPILFKAGVRDFGESRVQDALAKQESLPKEMSEAIRWHLIGHLQGNKVNKTLGVFDLIHSVDSLDLIQRLAAANQQAGTCQKLLLQVNLTGEDQKYGFTEAEIEQAVELCLMFPEALAFDGLMCFGHPSLEPEFCEAVFSRLRVISADLTATYKLNNLNLSMGMSQDYAHALKNGATIIRIGRLLLDGLG